RRPVRHHQDCAAGRERRRAGSVDAKVARRTHLQSAQRSRLTIWLFLARCSAGVVLRPEKGAASKGGPARYQTPIEAACADRRIERATISCEVRCDNETHP